MASSSLCIRANTRSLDHEQFRTEATTIAVLGQLVDDLMPKAGKVTIRWESGRYSISENDDLVPFPDFVIQGSATYRILSDQLGSPRLAINASTGAVAQRMRRDEFGLLLEDTNPGFTPFGFGGGL